MAIDTRQSGNRVRLRWYDCQRCGFQYPEDKVLIQNGLVVCNGPNTNSCMDEPGHAAAKKALSFPYEQPNQPLPSIVEDL